MRLLLACTENWDLKKNINIGIELKLRSKTLLFLFLIFSVLSNIPSWQVQVIMTAPPLINSFYAYFSEFQQL
jgi:hypothetical protein